MMVIVGVVLNRLNVGLLGLLATSTTGYIPRWIEILVSAGVAAGGLLVPAVMNQTLPIVEVKPPDVPHAAPPGRVAPIGAAS